MKATAFWTIFLTLFVIFGIYGQAHADGVFFSDLQTHLYEPEQKAVILWDGRIETMILSARAQAANLKNLSQLVWIVPLDSSEEPLVEAGDINVFQDVIQFIKERRQRISYGAAAAVELKEIDIYDIAVLKADDAASLVRLIGSLGYVIPENASNLLQSCIESDMRYFVVNKIDLANKYGKRVQEIEALTKSLKDVDSMVLKNLLTRMPPGTAVPFEYAANRFAGQDRKTTTDRQIVYNVHAGSNIMSLLNLFRRAVIMSLMAGVPYRDSILNTELGEKMDFITEDDYQRMVSSCRLETDVYNKLQLYSGPGFLWDEYLMRGRQWSSNYSRVAYKPGYGPNVNLIVEYIGRYNQGINTVFQDGRMVIYFNQDLKERLAQHGISEEAYKKFLEKNLYPVELKYKKAFDALNMDKLTYYAAVFKELTDVSQGIATPIKITFKPSKPLYPLKISALNQGTTKIEVYFCAAYPAEDINGFLKVDKFKRLSYKDRKKLGFYFGSDAGAYLTRLSYDGQLSALSADAFFKRASGSPVETGEIKSDDEKAFEAIFSKKRAEEALIGVKIAEGRKQYGRDFYKWGHPGSLDEDDQRVLAEKEIQSLQLTVHQKEMAEMQQFVKNYPHSKYADDAATLLILNAKNLDPSIGADTLYEMFNLACTARTRIESFTLDEDASLAESIGEYEHAGIVHLCLKTILAGLFHQEGNSEMAAALAEQVISALQPHLKAPGTEMYDVCKPLHAYAQRLLPGKIKFDEYFDRGTEAFYDNRWDVAEKELEKAVHTSYGYYIQSNIRTLDEITNNILVAKFFLGLTRTQTGDWTGARKSFEELLETGAHFEAIFSRTIKGESYYLTISPKMVKAQIVVCHIREGRLTRALDEGLQLLQTISDAPGNWDLIAMVHYNVACVYALQDQKAKALSHLKECVSKDPSFKPYFMEDEDLKTLRNEPAFKNLIAE